jgi:mono/diheme cytochrome c family protein
MGAKSMRGRAAGAMFAAVLAAAGWAGRPASAQQPGVAQEPRGPAQDYDQRALEIYEFKKAAHGGPERGREIFYYKCWFCHNEFAKGAPPLKGVFQRDKLLSGRPTTEDGIKDEIRNGGAGMASYKSTLNDADLNDLVSYLKDRCCWDSNSPPPNPRYRFGAEE